MNRRAGSSPAIAVQPLRLFENKLRTVEWPPADGERLRSPGAAPRSLSVNIVADTFGLLHAFNRSSMVGTIP
jgi:hypothetical protein